MKLRYCEYVKLINFNNNKVLYKIYNNLNIYVYLNYKFNYSFSKIVFLYFYIQFINYCEYKNIYIKFNYNQDF